jgi:hypothetical protein
MVKIMRESNSLSGHTLSFVRIESMPVSFVRTSGACT